ncbi:hypothetical protein I4U23_018087 [Adineta vaga]|nr:hypothetical protein I4U23_018087 [Adineta vaga]
MDTTWKNRLQEYCQKQKISMPNYRIKNQSGPPHSLKFQVEVEVNNHWYVGDDMCSSKKEAEQSAAKTAWQALLIVTVPSTPSSTVIITEEHLTPPPSYSEVLQLDLKKHLPVDYAIIEAFIDDMVTAEGGRIRKISSPDANGQYKFEISGSYRYCENVKRQHKKNQIYFIVNPYNKTYFQKCHDPECYGFRSVLKTIRNEQIPCSTTATEEAFPLRQCSHCRTSLSSQGIECERCGEQFCRKCVSECDYCHDAIHCSTCFESCFDCHDS